MGKPHTTIGAEQFHFRVRNGIGWFTLAMAARQTGSRQVTILIATWEFERSSWHYKQHINLLLSQSLKLLECYMVKPHGQLVLVSFSHY
jgi:hypothetical protein